MKKNISFLFFLLCVISLYAQNNADFANNIIVKGENTNFWAKTPVIEIDFTNKSSEKISNLNYNFKVNDAYDNLVLEKDVVLKPVNPEEIAKEFVEFNVPYGKYYVLWTLKKGDKEIEKGSTFFAHLSEKCGENLSPSLEKYIEKTCPWGGVFWDCDPGDARAAGARWVRDFSGLWWYSEQEYKKVDIDYIRKGIMKYREKGIESMFHGGEDNRPSWSGFGTPTFSPNIGEFFNTISSNFKDIVHYYEFGNEDNDGTKFRHTEICKHCIAGVRKNDSTAMLGNSGTASVDVSWFEFQNNRNLFDGLDICITHPYTITSSPEEWGVYDQGQLMLDFIDRIGGFKELWSTEFGYSIELDGYLIPDTLRSEYLVRHFLIQIAAGYERPGLFAWDNYYGLYSDRKATESVVSVHNMAKLLEGYRYAGRIKDENNSWIVVYEKLGANPIVVAWNPQKETELSIKYAKAWDLLGNEIASDGNSIEISHKPVYLLSSDFKIIEEAYKESCLKEIARAEKLSGKSYGEKVDCEVLWKDLEKASKTYAKNHKREVSGTQYRLLNALIIMGRMGKLPKDADNEEIAANFIDNAKKTLEDYRLNDVDAPRLRFALHQYEKLEAERIYAIEEKSPYADRIRNAEKVLAVWASKYISKKNDVVQNQIWTYLYTYDKDGKSLCEKLTFVPGTTKRILGRVNNYAHNSCTATVSLDLPEWWTCEPKNYKLDLKAGKNENIYFDITPKSSKESKFEIIANTEIDGKPVNKSVMNDIVLQNPVVLSQIPMEGLLSDTPMKFNLKNVDIKPHKGKVNIYLAEDKSLLGSFAFDTLQPEESKEFEMSAGVGDKKIKNWKMYAEIIYEDGSVSVTDFSCDYLVALKTYKPITIDGDLSDWEDALPLHMDKEEYTNSSFGGTWTPEDLSAVTYYLWDDKYFYVAMVVKDQTFNQNKEGEATWNQDSIQFAVTPKEWKPELYEMSIALTPKGPQVFVNNCPAIENYGLRSDIPIQIKLSQGQAVYEMAIPWDKYEKTIGKGEVGRELAIDILINDDDVVATRRYMERFGIDIVHIRQNNTCGNLKLIDTLK